MSRFALKLEESGIILVLLHLILLQLSHRFPYDLSIDEKPVFWFVGLLIAAGFVYFLFSTKAIRFSDVMMSQKRVVVFIVAVGLILRISFMFSTPMLEDDFYRYLLDGAMVSRGINPYAYSPEEIINQQNIPAELNTLVLESNRLINRVNHPHLRTIYPPVAEAAFSLAYMLKPWNLTAWRFVLLICDLCSMGLLIVILQQLKMPAVLLLIFWWNPLYIKEIYNSAHMEGLLMPFLFGTVLCVIYKRHLAAVTCLAIATGVKLWPAVLLPILLRPYLKDFKKFLLFISFFIMLVIALFWPVYMAGFDKTSGFVAYGRIWEMNDSAFMLLFWALRFALSPFDLEFRTVHLLTKGIVFIILTIIIVIFNRKEPVDNLDFLKRCLGITAALFLLSPTQFPWYATWFLPFLALVPTGSLLLLTPLLPVYYLRFYFKAHGQAALFDNYLVWLEYIPVWTALFWQWHKGRKDKAGYDKEAY